MSDGEVSCLLLSELLLLINIAGIDSENYEHERLN